MSEASSPYTVSQSGMSPPVPPSDLPTIPTVIPKVFGIIHICYAALGGVAAFFGFAGMIMIKVMAVKGGKEFENLKPIMEAYEGMATYMYVDAGLKVLLTVMLLIAGIGLLKRKVWAIKLSVFWAVSRMLIAIGMLLWGMRVAAAFQEKLGTVPSGQQEQMQQVFQSVGNVLGIIILFIYPVVSLIFLTKKNVRDAMLP